MTIHGAIAVAKREELGEEFHREALHIKRLTDDATH
jgi:hypothetical protein